MNAAELFELVMSNPLTSGAVAAGVAAVVAFFKPVARAVQRALVRRIDQAWPDDEDDHETAVQRTADAVSARSLLPRGVVEAQVRKHKARKHKATPLSRS